MINTIENTSINKNGNRNIETKRNTKKEFLSKLTPKEREFFDTYCTWGTGRNVKADYIFVGFKKDGKIYGCKTSELKGHYNPLSSEKVFLNTFKKRTLREWEQIFDSIEWIEYKETTFTENLQGLFLTTLVKVGVPEKIETEFMRVPEKLRKDIQYFWSKVVNRKFTNMSVKDILHKEGNKVKMLLENQGELFDDYYNIRKTYVINLDNDTLEYSGPRVEKEYGRGYITYL